MPVAEDKCDKEHGAGMRREKKTNWTQGGVGKREKVIRSGRMMEGGKDALFIQNDFAKMKVRTSSS